MSDYKCSCTWGKGHCRPPIRFCDPPAAPMLYLGDPAVGTSRMNQPASPRIENGRMIFDSEPRCPEQKNRVLRKRERSK